MKSLWNKNPITWWEGGIYIAILVLAGSVKWIFFSSEENNFSFQKTEESYALVHPELSPAFSTQKLLGSIYSNTFAMIHPRREGIIKDILVDVGDTISTGQTIAFLFPPGVEGQGSSQIAKARAEFLTAQEALANAQNVSQESIGVAEKNLSQVATQLETTLGNSGTQRSMLEQQYDQAESAAFQIMQNIQRVLFGDSLQARNSSLSIVGNFNNSLQENKVFQLFQEAQRKEKSFSDTPRGAERRTELREYLQTLNLLLDEIEVLYRTASVSSVHSEAQISQHIQTLQSSQSRILQIQDTLDTTLLTAEKIQSSLQTAEKNLTLSQSQAERSIDEARNRLEVARAAYQNELVRSGHEKVVSPFSGEIVARMTDVGHMVHPSQALFEIIGANTNLAQTTHSEIRFGLPERMFDWIEEGDKIQFSIPGKSESFSATITRKADSIDQRSRTAMIHAVPEDESPLLPHNTSVFVEIANTENAVFAVPSSSIKRRRNEYFLWIQDEEKNIWQVPVTVLAEDGEYSDVRGGLTLESNVIVNPSASLFRKSTPLHEKESSLSPSES